MANILVPLCHSYNEQMLLCSAGAIPLLGRLMTTPYVVLQVPALNCLASMCFTNRTVSDTICSTRYDFIYFVKNKYLLNLSFSYKDNLIMDILTSLLSRANAVEI